MATSQPPKPPQTPPLRVVRRNRGFEATSVLVQNHLKGPAQRRGFAETKLLARWAEIVGSELAAICAPVQVRHGRGTSLGTTLVVLTTGAHAPILSMRSEELVEKVNACYGYRAVAKLQITQTAPTGFAEGQAEFAAKPSDEPLPEPDPEDLAAAEAWIAQVEDDGLREALQRLARKVLTKNSKSQGD